MKYEAPMLTLFASAGDPLMVSLNELYAINLWDMLLEGEE